MRNFRNIISTLIPNKTKTFVSAFIATAVLATAAGVFAGWSPDRPTFDYNKTNENCAVSTDHDRCGSMDGPVWNSFVNTPFYGDERAFFDARRSDTITGGDIYKDVLSGVTQNAQKEVVLRTYIHNNANGSTNATVGVAKDSKVRIDLPTGTSTMLRARSYISSSNVAPGYPAEVTDTAELVDTTPFGIEYISGSALICNAAHPCTDNNNDGIKEGGVRLADSIVSNGAAIGYDQMNGDVPGCFEYQAFVEIRVKVKQPEITFNKEVRKENTTANPTTYGEIATVKPGEKVQWKIAFKNTGNADVNDVFVSDQLPPHNDVVPGSVRYIYRGTDNQDHDDVQNDKPLFTKPGIDTGDWQPNGGWFIRFDTIAKDDFQGCEVTVRNIAYLKREQKAEQPDNADLKIVKENCQPTKPVAPAYSCDLLNKQHVSGRTYRFTTNTTATGGATVKQFNYEFNGVGYKQTAVTNQAQGTVEHTFPKAGSYAVTVSVDFNVDNTVKSHTSDACKTTIEITDVAVPVAVTTAPKTLPNTGAGEVVGLFTAVTTLGAVTHRVRASRRD